MPDPLTNPLGPLLPLVLALGLGALRWVPALILVPIFAPHALSRIARIAVALALALPIVPGLLPAIAARAPSPDLALGLALGLAAKECAIGLLLATVLAVPLWAVESAGTCLDYQRGANAQALDPTASPDASVFGALFKHASCVYLIHAGALHALVAVVYASFAVWPPLAWLPALDSGTWAAIEPLLTAMMRLAVLLALPYLLALVLVEVCFAVLSRAAPRFPAYIAALPFKSVLALLVVALSLPALLDALAQATFAHAEATMHLLDRMRADRP